jgi:hypothetical protein
VRGTGARLRPCQTLLLAVAALLDRCLSVSASKVPEGPFRFRLRAVAESRSPRAKSSAKRAGRACGASSAKTLRAGLDPTTFAVAMSARSEPSLRCRYHTLPASVGLCVRLQTAFLNSCGSGNWYSCNSGHISRQAAALAHLRRQWCSADQQRCHFAMAVRRCVRHAAAPCHTVGRLRCGRDACFVFACVQHPGWSSWQRKDEAFAGGNATVHRDMPLLPHRWLQ